MTALRRFALTPNSQARHSDVLVGRGLLEDMPTLLAQHAPAFRYVLVSDETVASLHAKPLSDRLAGAGLRTDLLQVPVGEHSKCAAEWVRLTEALAERDVGRDACVIAVGGGVVGDLAGFVAATYVRGVPFVQVPTTLVAMVDASIGGKTGIDLDAGKNLVGAFHQPLLVVADPAVLATLPDVEIRYGAAEAVKHGAVADADYLTALVDDAGAVLGRDSEALERAVTGSVAVKTAIVGEDALESGKRATLNFGHTIGHAIEAVHAYTVPHGAAVAIGMVAEAALGERLGETEAGTADRLRTALSAYGLPTRLPAGTDPDALVDATRVDKKARKDEVRYTILARIGQVARPGDGAWTWVVGDDDVRAVIDRIGTAA